MRAGITILGIILGFFCALTAEAQNQSYCKYQIWGLDAVGRPAPIRLTLGKFANFLKSHKAEISAVEPADDLLELRVSDPRMNMNDHIIHTYVFKLDKKKQRALCARFLLNGQEIRGVDFLKNTSFLFKIIAGLRNNLSSDYDFKISNKIPGEPLTNGEFYAPASADICGRVLVNLPVNSYLSFLLIEADSGNRPYFYLKDQCSVNSPALCGRILQNARGDDRMRANGINIENMEFIHQCRPFRDSN